MELRIAISPELSHHSTCRKFREPHGRHSWQPRKNIRLKPLFLRPSDLVELVALITNSINPIAARHAEPLSTEKPVNCSELRTAHLTILGTAPLLPSRKKKPRKLRCFSTSSAFRYLVERSAGFSVPLTFRTARLFWLTTSWSHK